MRSYDKVVFLRNRCTAIYIYIHIYIICIYMYIYIKSSESYMVDGSLEIC